MLRSLKQLYGSKLGASDGEIGHIIDFYFDEQQWAVRYVVADTGSWLTGRLVLISPPAFEAYPPDSACLPVAQSREQIGNSPAIGSHKPVSRQYEEEYYRYYGWPSYWEGGGIWGMSGFPIAPPPRLVASEQLDLSSGPTDDDDPHLQSATALDGYHILTKDGPIGHVTDFIIDDKTWAICHVIVETGQWYSGKEIAISSKHIDRISYDDSTVFVSLTKDSILKAPLYHLLPPFAAARCRHRINQPAIKKHHESE